MEALREISLVLGGYNFGNDPLKTLCSVIVMRQTLFLTVPESQTLSIYHS